MWIRIGFNLDPIQLFMSMLIRIQYRIRLQRFVIVKILQMKERHTFYKKIAIYLSLGFQKERQKSMRIQIHNTAHNNAKEQGNQRILSESFENAFKGTWQ